MRANDLRDKIRLQTDGGLKTGLDVIKAAMLGAESFGFGTGPMVALGCRYLRICHLNNCATGIATQHEVLREEHFKGLPEMVINYFEFIAEEVREWLAKLGVRSLDELIGRTDLLEQIEGKTDRQQRLDLTPLIDTSGVDSSKPHYCTEPSNAPFDRGELAEQMVTDALEAIENSSGGEFSYPVKNINRSIGARLSGEIALRHGNHGMSDSPIKVKLTGSAGQSLGVWNAGGLHLTLEGDANDYVGKGMAGGQIAMYAPRSSGYAANETPIMGNTCLYGATGGKLYAAGLAGERFAVRNSGAIAVVEGIGDHGCEYMTGGGVVVLGSTGVNFGAAMTGGFAFILDMANNFVDHYNHELVDIHRMTTERMEGHCKYLEALIEEHIKATASSWAEEVLNNFDHYRAKFRLVKPTAQELDAVLDTLATDRAN